jgi:hypothetical protein
MLGDVPVVGGNDQAVRLEQRGRPHSGQRGAAGYRVGYFFMERGGDGFQVHFIKVVEDLVAAGTRNIGDDLYPGGGDRRGDSLRYSAGAIPVFGHDQLYYNLYTGLINFCKGQEICQVILIDENRRELSFDFELIIVLVGVIDAEPYRLRQAGA